MNNLRGLLLVFCGLSLLFPLGGCSDYGEEKIVDSGPTNSFLVETQSEGEFDDLLDIFFINTTNGWAVGGNGTIIHTTDGGQHWIPQNSLTSSTLYGVCFINGDTGWVVGAEGAIERTFDGGMAWQDMSLSNNAMLKAVTFLNVDSGWVVGDGVRLITANGGATWQPRSTEDTLLGVSFPDPSHGWMVGYRGVILRTDNGGQAWTPQWTGLSIPFYDVAAVDADNGWVVGIGGTIFHTSDGGPTWSRQDS